MRLSTRNRNVPVLSEIEMSPGERAIRPVGACGNRFVGFQAAVGAFLASTAAAASTDSSWLNRLGPAPLAEDGPGVAAPRGVLARPRGPMRGSRLRRPHGWRRGV